MRAGPRIALFATGLAVIFAIAFGLGSLLDPAETDAGGGHDGQMPQGHSSEGGSAAAAPSGLAVSGDGYTLRLEPILLAPRQVRQLRFRVIRADGGSVRDFDELHEREITPQPTPPPSSVDELGAPTGRKARPMAHPALATRSPSRPTFPTPGRYRLYLQFKHHDEVRTVEYRVEVPR